MSRDFRNLLAEFNVQGVEYLVVGDMLYQADNKKGKNMKRIMFGVAAMLALGAAIFVLAQAVENRGEGIERQRSSDTGNTYEGSGWEYLIVAGGTTNLSSSGSPSLRKEPGAGAFREAFPIEQNMDKLGAKGWELVAVSGIPGEPIYYFKRRK